MGKGRQRRRRKGRKWKSGLNNPISTSIAFRKLREIPKIFQIEVSDEVISKAQKIFSLLPKKDCGSCGYDSCYDCAIAIAKGEAAPDACKVSGRRIKAQVEKILNS